MTNSLLITESNYCCQVRLNRPEKKNAFNQNMLEELQEHFDSLTHGKFRVLILSGVGNTFCAGADLSEMAELAQANDKKNFQQALLLAQLLDKLDNLPLYTIARVSGACFGGAIGLICCCDMVIAEEKTQFCFSELKLGLVPATILPYVLKKIGTRHARRYVLSSEIFGTQQALEMGLIDTITTAENLEHLVHLQCHQVGQTQPNAFILAKQLIQKNAQLNEKQIRMSAHQLAQIRGQAEARQCIEHFLQRKSGAKPL